MAEKTEIELLQDELRRLTMELEETTAILELREEELKANKRDEGAVAELYSLLSNKELELESTKQAIQKSERKAIAAINFQEELLNDMDAVKTIEKQNQQLQSQIAALQSEAEIQQLEQMRNEKRLAAAENKRITELEMQVEELQLENLKLQNKITRLDAGNK